MRRVTAVGVSFRSFDTKASSQRPRSSSFAVPSGAPNFVTLELAARLGV